MNRIELKAFARKAARVARTGAFARGQGHAAARLTEVLEGYGGAALAGYWPIQTEIDPRPAMEAHFGPVGLPVIAGAGLPLLFRRWSPGCLMVPGPYGAEVPDTDEEMVPSVLIVPLLAFDRDGFRLGYGGGFYDRTLEGLRARGPVTAIGFAFAAQEIEEVPIEPTDQPLDLIVTEEEVIVPGEDPPL